jgi:hypothetical protein
LLRSRPVSGLDFPGVVDQSERLRHALDEGLDADEADIGVGAGLRDQVLAAAEADLEAGVRRAEKHRGRIDRAVREGQGGQQRLDQRLAARRQRPARAAAVEAAIAGNRGFGVWIRHPEQSTFIRHPRAEPQSGGDPRIQAS